MKHLAIVLIVGMLAGCGQEKSDTAEVAFETLNEGIEESSHEFADKNDSFYNAFKAAAENTASNLSDEEDATPKYEPDFVYKDFPAEITDNGEGAMIDYSSNEAAIRFKTVITTAYDAHKEKFGGHYIIASWGCGTGCQQCVIVDTQDGKVYIGPTASGGYTYKEDSRLLIVNGPDDSGYFSTEECCSPQLWVWDEDQKNFIQK